MSGKRKTSGTQESQTNPNKKSRKSVTLEIKHDIIRQYENGAKVHELGTKFKLAVSTISTIIKCKEKYLEEVKKARPMQSTRVRVRDNLVSEMETLLISWVEDQTMRLRMPLNQRVISTKALAIFEALKAKKGEAAINESFNASKGWFERFKTRAKFHNIKVQGEAASADSNAAKTFPQELAQIIEDGGYCLKQIFNVDETGLFWKKLPSKTYIAKEEMSMPGYKVAKERLTLLLGANAAGDFKLKPMLVYRSETPRAIAGLNKKTLPVIWKSNRKAWVTSAIFEDWFINYFIPQVKRYCSDNDIPFNVLLLLDNAPGHPKMLQHQNRNVKIVFLPPNTTALLQPMDQGVIASFKAYYLRRTFTKLLEAMDREDGPTLKEYWKSFDIYQAVKIIRDSWNEVKQSNLKGVWKKLCPQLVQNVEGALVFEDDDKQVDFEGFEDPLEEVIAIANKLNLEVTVEDVDELLASHQQELSVEDLVEMENQIIMEEKEEAAVALTPPPSMTVKRLAEAFRGLESSMNIFETDDPDFQRSLKVNSLIKEAYACYREIYYEKKKSSTVQKTLDTYFKKTPAIPEDPHPLPSRPSTIQSADDAQPIPSTSQSIEVDVSEVISTHDSPNDDDDVVIDE